MIDVEISSRLGAFSLEAGFRAEEGCTGILGASGCGKSITLKSIAGICTPDRGRICLSGPKGERVLFDSSKRICLPVQKRRVGYLFQNYALFPNMTAEENILCGLKGSKQSSRERLKELISQFHLEGLEKKYPHQLSGGQQQRTALARIFASEPELLLLDEPFSALDAHLKEQMRLEMLAYMKAYEKTALLVTHDRDEAYQLCSRLILMDAGHVLQQGTTQEVFSHPVNTAAARLTGCKNISRIRWIGSHRVWAEDWGIELCVAEQRQERIKAIGIRAHDFYPLSEGENDVNVIKTGHVQISELPFEWYVTLENGIWWKVTKTIHNHSGCNLAPAALGIRPEHIILLEE